MGSCHAMVGIVIIVGSCHAMVGNCPGGKLS